MSPIPKLVERFVHAIETGGPNVFLATLHGNASVIDDGRTYAGADITEWAAKFFDRQPCSVRILGFKWKSGEFQFKAEVENRESGSTAIWRYLVRIQDDKILSLDLSSRYQIALPAIAEDFIEAVNRGDNQAILSLFKDTALINDEFIEYRGKSGIDSWVWRNCIANRLRIIAVDLYLLSNSITVTTHAFGDFEQEGLPDPLVLNLYFSIADGQIEHLILLQCPFACEPDVAKSRR